MKFFKSVRAWLATALCACMCITGGLAVNSLTKKEAQATTGATVEVSSDIQMLVDGLNASLNGSNAHATAEYKYDFTMSNGAKASGILITQDMTQYADSVGLYESNLQVVSNLTFNVSTFTGDTPMFSYIIAPVTGEEYYTKADRYIPNQNNKNDFKSADFSIGITNVGNYNGWAVFNNDDVDASVPDAAGNPSNGVRLHTYNAVASGKDNRGCYYDDTAGYLVGTRGYAPISFVGNQTTPFSVYYDYATNVVYRDIHPTSTHKTSTHRLLGFPNVQPSEFGALASTFDNKYCGKTGFALDAYTGATTFSNNVAGFENGQAQIIIRMGTIYGTKLSVLLTNVMGLDLSNPNNTFANDKIFLTAEEETFPVNEEVEIIAPIYKTFASVAPDKVFDGTVDIYKGERSFKGAYGSYGSTVASFENDTALTLLAEDVAVGSNYTFTETGAYTFVYTDTEGNVAYTTKTVSKGTNIVLDNVNTTVLRNGEELKSGDIVIAGDELTFVANDGYTLYNFTSAGTGTYQIVKNEVVTTANNNVYTVTEADCDNDALNIISAAHKGRYTVNLNRSHYMASGYASAPAFVGVPSSYYKHFDKQAFANGNYYSLWSYDGTNVTIMDVPWHNNIASWRSSTYGVETEINSSRRLTSHDLIGFNIKNYDTKENIAVFKSGLNRSSAPLNFELTCNTEICVMLDSSSIDVSSSFIKTAGTVGLSVKFKMLKYDYDVISNAMDFKTYAVVVPAKYYNDLKSTIDGDKKPYRINNLKSSNSGKIASIAVDNWIEETINGVEYMSFYVTLKNINVNNYAEGYYFGAFYNLHSDNGGEYMCFGGNEKSDESFPKISVLEAAQAGFSANVTTENDGTATASVSLNGVDYYSSTVTEREIEILVKFYNYGLYLKGVSLESIHGYEAVNVDDVTYYIDGEYVTVDTAEQIITFAKNVMGVA